MAASTWRKHKPVARKFLCVLMVDAQLFGSRSRPRGTADQASLYKDRRQKESLPVDNRARSGGHPCPPESSRASACRRFRMAADLRKHAPGRPGFQRRGNAAGSGLGARERKQVELWPLREPSERQQERLQASRGPCGRANGISPRGTRSARPTQSQRTTRSFGGISATRNRPTCPR